MVLSLISSKYNVKKEFFFEMPNLDSDLFTESMTKPVMLYPALQGPPKSNRQLYRSYHDVGCRNSVKFALAAMNTALQVFFSFFFYKIVSETVHFVDMMLFGKILR